MTKENDEFVITEMNRMFTFNERVEVPIGQYTGEALAYEITKAAHTKGLLVGHVCKFNKLNYVFYWVKT